MMAISGSKEFH